MRGYDSIDKLTWDECQALLSTENSPERIEAIQERLEILAREIKIKDDNAFASCKTLKDFKDYITAYPNGTHIGKAKDKIKLLEKQKEEKLFSSAKTIADYEEYISKYPYGAFVREATLRMDDLFFAKNSGSKTKCERYLAKYPNGRHKQEAVTMINRTNRNRVIFVVLIIIAIILFLIGFNPSGQVILGSITNDTEYKVNKKVALAFNSHKVLAVPVVLIAQSSNSKNLSFPKEGGKQEVSFSSGASSENVEVNSSSSWISAKKVGGGKIVITVSKNEGAERSGIVEVKAYSTLFGVRTGSNSSTIYVKQSTGHASYINVTCDDITFDQYGGSKNITVTSDGYWSIGESIASWGHLSINGNAISIRVDPNSSEDRSDYFTIKSGSTTRRIDVSQSGKPATYFNLEKDEVNASITGTAEGRCYPVIYDTDGKTIKTYTYCDWITSKIAKSSSRVEIKVQANNGSRRTGTVYVEASGIKRSITVTQKGKTSTLSLDHSTWTFDTGSDYDYFDINTDGDESLSANTYADWITASITSSGRLKISVSKNSGSSREGTVYVKCGGKSTSIKIKQKGYHNCYKCFNGMYSTGQVWGVSGQYWDPYLGWLPQYGWVSCDNCGGTGKVKD